MAMSAKHKSKFAELHLLWWRLQMSEKFLSGTIYPKQTNKQTNKLSATNGWIIPMLFNINNWSPLC